ncbi:MFS transporter [Microbacterium sp.]|uniref:MFS transporter n=1 Tax=Microbacterium sp. TaxID=51671 RepID=UPI003A947643
MSKTLPALPDAAALGALQRRTIWVLALGQVLGGLAFGATVSVGAILAARVSGDEAFSGWATASVTLGTAATAVPLAALARRHGRRPALAVGMLVALVGVGLVVTAVAVWAFPLLVVGFLLIGAGQAANLQSRFAAADLATDTSRARDLSIVVWATTLGAVLGPNLVGPGEAIGGVLGMPQLTGAYVFTVLTQGAGIVLYLVFLRPDPLTVAQRVTAHHAASGARLAHPDRPAAARYAMLAIAGAHAVMVSVMAMTPVHLEHAGATIEIIGLTISLHIAGMYALSPVFGILADKLGRLPVIILGQIVLVAAMLTAALGQYSTAAVTVALILLGLGWSATTVAGATLLTEASAEDRRTRRQGHNDLIMSFVGGVGAILAGLVLAWIGYGGLALTALAVIAVVVVCAPLGRTHRRAPIDAGPNTPAA